MAFPMAMSDLESCILEDGKTILLTITNSGYLLYTLNMLKSLSKYDGLDRNVLTVCMDRMAYNVLRERGYQAIHVEQENLGRFFAWNTKGYEEVCYWKMVSVHRLLTNGCHVILVDGDIVFRKDPRLDWRRWWESSDDVWIQNDSQNDKDTTNLCTGYMLIRSTSEMCQVYDCISEEGRKRYDACIFDNNDQTYFNRYVKPLCRWSAFLLEHYPNGKMYQNHKERLDSLAVLVHFNWIKGHMKMAIMKQNGMWLLTPEEETI